MSDQALKKLRALLVDRLNCSQSDRDIHGRSETHFSAMAPDAVAYPKSTDEVAKIIQICAAHRMPVIGWGVGTSLEGQTQALHGGISVDFSHMKQLLEVRPEDMTVRIQPGLTREELNQELRATGLFFPVDPGANATLGGMAATRASGTTAVRYGTMRDNVLALEAVTADGEIIRTGTGARKSSAGYDLTGLMVGSEGTLGLITELTLRLQGQPEAIASAVCAFPNVQGAVDAVIETIQIGIPMARIELMDVTSVQAVTTYSGMDLPDHPHLLLEFHGSEAGVAEQSESFGSIAADHGGSGFSWATKAEDRSRLWKMRHDAFHAIKACRPGHDALVTDICVPISKLAQAIASAQEDIAAEGLFGPILGHVGDGNFHAVFLFDPADKDELKRIKQISDRMVEHSLKLGGTATGEHGIGVGKLGFMQDEHGAAWAVMGAIKQALDPDNIMNPGKLVPPRN